MDDIAQAVSQRLLERLGGAEELRMLSTTRASAPPQTAKGVYILYTVILFLSLCMTAFFYSKCEPNTKVVPPPVEAPIVIRPPQPPPTVKDDELRQMLIETDKKLDALNKRVDVIAHRQWLLGIANNENACLNEYLHPESKYQYLYLDRSWRFSKTPEFIKMTDEERQEMLKSLKSR